MDIDFLRTFLEVNRTRHFGKAAKSLFITQSTVSTRIGFIEKSLNTKLFTRDRNDIQLTKAGENLLSQAESIVRQWDETRKSMADNRSDFISLNIGCVSSLWDILLLDWLIELKVKYPDIFIKGEGITAERQINGLLARVIDIGFMFEPPKIAELVVRELSDVELRLYSTQKDIQIIDAVSQNYILVEWGTQFLTEHSRWFPELPMPGVHFDSGRWAVEYLLKSNGAAYLPASLIPETVINKRIFEVTDSPIFKRTAFAVYNLKSKNREQIEHCLTYLK